MIYYRKNLCLAQQLEEAGRGVCGAVTAAISAGHQLIILWPGRQSQVIVGDYFAVRKQPAALFTHIAVQIATATYNFDQLSAGITSQVIGLYIDLPFGVVTVHRYQVVAHLV